MFNRGYLSTTKMVSSRWQDRSKPLYFGLLEDTETSVLGGEKKTTELLLISCRGAFFFPPKSELVH